MAIRQIRFETDEILKKKSKEVTVIDEKIKSIANDMIDTLYKFDGIGLAACQVGFLKQIVVYDVDYVKDPNKKNAHVIINPVIVSHSNKMITTEEGCLSFPDIFGNVDRFQKIKVEALNLNGEKITINAKDIEAVVLQHEIDHLNGIVFLDKAYDIYRYQEKEEKPSKKEKKLDKNFKNNTRKIFS